MDKEDKRKIEEYKNNPMSNFSDSVNHSKMGDLTQLTKSSLITRIITIAIIIGLLIFIFLRSSSI